MSDIDVRPLPEATDDFDRAEHDLRSHGICALVGVLDDVTLSRVRTDLYTAADDDRTRGREQRGFPLDPDETNQRVWNLPSRSPVFVDLAGSSGRIACRLRQSSLAPSRAESNDQPASRRRVRLVHPADLSDPGELVPVARPGVHRSASEELLVLLGYRTEGLGLVNGISPG